MTVRRRENIGATERQIVRGEPRFVIVLALGTLFFVILSVFQSITDITNFECWAVLLQFGGGFFLAMHAYASGFSHEKMVLGLKQKNAPIESELKMVRGWWPTEFTNPMIARMNWTIIETAIVLIAPGILMKSGFTLLTLGYLISFVDLHSR